MHTDFLRAAVDDLETRIQQVDPAIRIEHHRGSYHAVYLGSTRLFGYYFTADYIYSFFPRVAEEEEELLREELTQADTLQRNGGGLRFHVVNESDLELVVRIVAARVTQGAMA